MAPILSDAGLWSFLNVVISGATLAYVVRTEHRITILETQARMRRETDNPQLIIHDKGSGKGEY